MNDNQLLRYSRHILLPQMAYEGQQRLTQAHMLIIGAGGLGSPAALYLAAAGVGRLTICDFDQVDLTNLQRQIIHSTDAIGNNKALSAQQTLHRLNPEVEVRAVTDKAEMLNLEQLIEGVDVVLDCSDNFVTRYLINQHCHKNQIPLVSGAAVGFDGQLTVFDFRLQNSPCYACLFPDDGTEHSLRCADNGVFSPLVGIIGAMQAAEAIKLCLDLGDALINRLVLLDALTMQSRTIQYAQDPACQVCRKR